MHKNKINSKVYIGITGRTPKERWGYNGNGYARNMHFNNAIKKYGWNNFEHIILFENLTKKEAIEKEKELIKFYDAINRDKGYNISHGGEGTNVISEETKKKLSESHKGIYPSEETRKKLSACKKGKNNPNYGKKMTPEQKEILRNATKGRIRTEEEIRKFIKSRGNAVHQYDLNGRYLNTYDSARDAARKTNTDSSSLKQCCNKNHRHANNFIWRYEKDGYAPHVDIDISKEISPKKNMSPVNQYDLNGRYIRSFSSIKEAASYVNCSKSNIFDAVSGRQNTAKGFIWKYKNIDNKVIV